MYGPRQVYGADGTLTDAAIVWLARKTWWGEPGEQTGITVDRRDPLCWVKRRPLALWYGAERWPVGWPWGTTWVLLGDGVQVRLVADQDGPYAEVRRPRCGLSYSTKAPAAGIAAGGGEP